MKLSNKIKKVTGSLIILSVIVMPFSGLLELQKVEAQTVNSGININGGASNNSISGYLKTIGPLAKDLPGCVAEMGKGIKNLFSGGLKASDMGSALTGTEITKTKGAENNLSFKAEKGVLAGDSVTVTDPTVTAMLGTSNLNLKNIQESTADISKNKNCLDAVGKAIIKLLIQKMTLSIINWIQNGNEGNSFHPDNLSKYFGDVAKNQILSFGLEINNSTKYPFGKDFMQGVANSYNSTFQQNAKYSLDKMIKDTTPEYSAKSFNQDFSAGGWGAWEAMTQVPANNPLGFQLMASNELATRLDGTSESPAQVIKDQLQQSGGYLDQQMCTDPWGLSKQKSDAALKAGVVDSKGKIVGVCKTWKSLTPGDLIGHELTSAVDKQDHALLNVSTLNDAIVAISDAAIAKFSNDLTQKGLAGVSTNESDYNQYTSSNENSNSQTQNDFTDSQISSSTWLSQNPEFNIRTDLNQALVDQQQTYVDKLYSLDDHLGNLIKWIRQLDYCIPGPNPDWETNASSAIGGIGDPSLKKEWWDSAVATTAASMLGGAGSITGGLIGGKSSTIGGPIGGVIGSVVGAGFSMITSNIEKNDISKTYANAITKLLGVNIYSAQDQVTDPASLSGLLNNVLKSYSSLVNQIYFTPGIIKLNGEDVDTSTYMPPVTLEARSEWEKISGYLQMIKDSAQKLVTMSSTINRLKAVKIAVDNLNNDLANGTVKDDNGDIASDQQAQYEINLAPYKNSFAGLSADLVSGDDIAGVNDLINQAVAEQSYVKDNLLEEPGDGCEPYLEHLWNSGPTGQTIYTKYVGREYYPLQIDHYYPPINWLENKYVGPADFISTNPSDPTYKPVGKLDPNEGFLYGSTYLDSIGGNQRNAACEANKRWLGWVEVKTGDESASGNLGGLNAYDSPPNQCGVVLNFERNFDIY